MIVTAGLIVLFLVALALIGPRWAADTRDWDSGGSLVAPRTADLEKLRGLDGSATVDGERMTASDAAQQ